MCIRDRRRKPRFTTSFKRASQACRHSGGVKDAARALLAEQPSPGNDATWERLRAKFPDDDPAAVEQAVADAIAESRIGAEDGIRDSVASRGLGDVYKRQLWYLLPGLLHSFDGRVTRRGRYEALKRGDISSLLP